MSIQEEIKQSRPFKTPNQEAVVSLLRTASKIRTHFEQIAGEEGITIQQYNVLRILRGSKTPVTTHDVGDRLIEASPGISRLMDRLEKKGLIERCRASDDRRCVLCSITSSGRQALTKLEEPISKAGEQLFKPTSEEDVAILIRVLENIRSTI